MSNKVRLSGWPQIPLILIASYSFGGLQTLGYAAIGLYISSVLYDMVRS